MILDILKAGVIRRQQLLDEFQRFFFCICHKGLMAWMLPKSQPKQEQRFPDQVQSMLSN
jgi:hypothetical protein